MAPLTTPNYILLPSPLLQVDNMQQDASCFSSCPFLHGLYSFPKHDLDRTFTDSKLFFLISIFYSCLLTLSESTYFNFRRPLTSPSHHPLTILSAHAFPTMWGHATLWYVIMPWSCHFVWRIANDIFLVYHLSVSHLGFNFIVFYSNIWPLV